jgi:hypothetical protein
MLNEGVYTSVSDIGDAENISKCYVSCILRLTLLAPDIVEAILAGKAHHGMMLEQLERPLPAAWLEQRAGPGAIMSHAVSSGEPCCWLTLCFRHRLSSLLSTGVRYDLPAPAPAGGVR